MQVIQGIANYIISERPCYMALGNFDGVHLGHQRLLKSLVEKSQSHGGVAAAFMFDPHPTRILVPENHALMLINNGSKNRLMASTGVETVIYEPFTREIAAWPPEYFVQEVLIKAFQVKEVFIGFNHTFGHKGQGKPETLRMLGQKYGFEVTVIPPVELDGQVVSSSGVRQALTDGNIPLARRMLGYYPFVEGVVVHGDKRGGDKLGFPTANINIGSDCAFPGKGVYAAKTLVNGQLRDSVVNIGIVPTFRKDGMISIESHIIDFSEEIYGDDIRIYFIEKIRDEKKFEGIEELVAQISQDVQNGRRIASEAPVQAV